MSVLGGCRKDGIDSLRCVVNSVAVIGMCRNEGYQRELYLYICVVTTWDSV